MDILKTQYGAPLRDGNSIQAGHSYRHFPRTMLLAVTGMLSVLTVARVAGAAETDSEEKSIWSNFSGQVSLYSDYVARGRLKNDGNPVLQGSLTYTQPLDDSTGLYLGVWGTHVDFNDNATNSEIIGYAGIYHSIDKLSLKAEVSYLHYAGAPDLDYDYFTVWGEASYDFGPVYLGVGLEYSPQFFGASGTATYLKAFAGVPLTKNISARAHIAHQDIERWQLFGFPDYTDWGLGISYSIAEHGVSFSVDYSDTDITDKLCAVENWCDPRLVFGVTKTF